MSINCFQQLTIKKCLSTSVFTADTVTTTTNVIIVHLYVEAPPAGLYDVIDDYLANSLNCSSDDDSNSTTNGTDCAWDGPFVNFTADFTSYFIGGCSNALASRLIPSVNTSCRFIAIPMIARITPTSGSSRNAIHC